MSSPLQFDKYPVLSNSRDAKSSSFREMYSPFQCNRYPVLSISRDVQSSPIREMSSPLQCDRCPELSSSTDSSPLQFERCPVLFNSRDVVLSSSKRIFELIRISSSNLRGLNLSVPGGTCYGLVPLSLLENSVMRRVQKSI